MLIPPSDISGSATHARPRIRHLIRWALLLLLATVICMSSSLSGSAAHYAAWLRLAAVLSAAGAMALLIAAGVAYRRQKSESLFPADSILEQDPPVLWGASKHAGPE